MYHAKWPEWNEDCIGEIGRRLQDHVDEHAGKDGESNLLLTFIPGWSCKCKAKQFQVNKKWKNIIIIKRGNCSRHYILRNYDHR